MATAKNSTSEEVTSTTSTEVTRNYNSLSLKEKAALKKSADTKAVTQDAKQASINKIIEAFFDHLKKESITVTVALSGLKKAAKFYKSTSATAIFRLGFQIAEAGGFDLWIATTLQELTTAAQLFEIEFTETKANNTDV